jgi:hypothetical protein
VGPERGEQVSVNGSIGITVMLKDWEAVMTVGVVLSVTPMEKL